MYNNDAILLQRCKPNHTPHKYVIEKVDFWVQFHNLPIEYLKEKIILKLAKGIGEPKPMLLGEQEKWSKFARANISINATEPLCQTINLTLTNGELEEISLKYEKLSHICYICGLLGHTQENCIKLKELQNTILSEYPEELHHELFKLLEPKITEEIKVGERRTAKKSLTEKMFSIKEKEISDDSQSLPLPPLLNLDAQGGEDGMM